MGTTKKKYKENKNLKKKHGNENQGEKSGQWQSRYFI